MGERIAVDRQQQTRSKKDLSSRTSIAYPDVPAIVAHREMAETKASAGRTLVIVESPAKAKTIAGYLGKDYMVESSIGHVRDLPHSAAEVPAAQKQEPWARLGVDVDHDFEPLYVVDPKKKSVVTDLRGKLENGRPAAARDRRRPRGRGDRLAPRRGAEAEGAGAPDGLPRDHEAGDRARARARRATSTSASSTRRRRAASSTASTATRSRPSSGGR